MNIVEKIWNSKEAPSPPNQSKYTNTDQLFSIIKLLTGYSRRSTGWRKGSESSHWKMRFSNSWHCLFHAWTSYDWALLRSLRLGWWSWNDHIDLFTQVNFFKYKSKNTIITCKHSKLWILTHPHPTHNGTGKNAIA